MNKEISIEEAVKLLFNTDISKREKDSDYYSNVDDMISSMVMFYKKHNAVANLRPADVPHLLCFSWVDADLESSASWKVSITNFKDFAEEKLEEHAVDYLLRTVDGKYKLAEIILSRVNQLVKLND